MTSSASAGGLLSAGRVITYCGGGIAATVDAFCLALMGHDNVAVYDGSLLDRAPDPGPRAGRRRAERRRPVDHAR